MARVASSALAALAVACGEAAAPTPPPVDVVVAPVEQRDVPIVTEWIGTTEGAIDAEIRAQVTGTLMSREYAEGKLVKAGDLMFRIDPRSYRAALEQARGDLGRAEAALGKSRLDVARYTPLAREGAVSQQELDNAIQSLRANEALVQTARAAVDQADLNLEFTDVRAPVDGIAGIAKAQVGDLVGPNDPKPLTTVSQVDPIRASYPLSERQYLAVAEGFRQSIDSGAPRWRGADGSGLQLVLADGSIWPHRGEAVPASEGVDSRTGTILVRAEFPNPGFVLRPGLYARVRAVTEVRKDALLIPQRAVTDLQGVSQVAVVDADDKVEIRVVELGPRVDSSFVVNKGLAAGDRIVVEGIQKVRAGSVVNPTTAGAAAPAPKG
jgi:membrane fusion protein (multidrug efflux system)